MSDYQNTIYFNSTSSATTTANILYSGATMWSDPLTYRAVQTVDGMKAVPYKSPEIQRGLVEGAARPEDPLAWLKRRVNEVCWTPA